jgi:hypothetical protein
MHESPVYKVQLEGGDWISVYMNDDRVMSKSLKAEYTDWAYKRNAVSDFEKLLKELTGAVWQAGVIAGKQDSTKKLQEIKTWLQDLLAE